MDYARLSELPASAGSVAVVSWNRRTGRKLSEASVIHPVITRASLSEFARTDAWLRASHGPGKPQNSTLPGGRAGRLRHEAAVSVRPASKDRKFISVNSLCPDTPPGKLP